MIRDGLYHGMAAAQWVAAAKRVQLAKGSATGALARGDVIQHRIVAATSHTRK